MNWGDGDIETIVGDPGERRPHSTPISGLPTTSPRPPTIPAAPTWQNDLLVGSSATDTVKRYEATTGAFLQTIGATSTMDYNIDVLVGPDGYIYACQR